MPAALLSTYDDWKSRYPDVPDAKEETPERCEHCLGVVVGEVNICRRCGLWSYRSKRGKTVAAAHVLDAGAAAAMCFCPKCKGERRHG